MQHFRLSTDNSDIKRSVNFRTELEIYVT